VTSNIGIEWLSESSECDQAGCSGGYATGAIVKLNGTTILELIPVARCWDSDSWDVHEVYRQLLMKLTGYTVEELYG
jgi:hypothetical protein